MGAHAWAVGWVDPTAFSSQSPPTISTVSAQQFLKPIVFLTRKEWKAKRVAGRKEAREATPRGFYCITSSHCHADSDRSIKHGKRRRRKKGLSRPAACPLCDQAEETADHLLVVCVFFPTSMVQTLALLNDLSLFDCWMATSTRVDGLIKNGFDSILIL